MDPKHSHGPDRVDYRELPGDLTEVHAAIQREHAEPTADVTPIPTWLTIICGVAVCWAGLYLGFFNGGLKGDVFNELSSNASLLFPAPGKAESNIGAPVADDPLVLGKTVYATCAACHQATGVGQPGAVPPLAKSSFVNGSEKRMAAIILKGLKGPVTVNGASFNSQMQAWEGAFSNKKLAAVATYIRSSFGNTAGPITEAQFAAARTELAPHKDQMTEPEILQIPEDATLPGADAPGGAAPAAGAAPAPAPAAGSPPATPVTAAPVAGAVVAAATTPAPGAPLVAAAAAPGAPPAPAATSGRAGTPEELAAGKATYMMTCIACHQITGAGLFPVFPPLTKSPYVNGSPERLIAIILKGNIGPFTVDGKPYNNIMTPQELLPFMTDDKIAAVATFVRASFENTSGAITKEQVAAVRAKFADRKTSWTQPELDAWKD